jgi:nicotinamide riboside transporter PnuC
MTDPENRWLRELGDEGYIDDRGFTAAVVSKLSPKRRGLRLPILTVFACLSAGVLALALPRLEPWLLWVLGLVVSFPAFASLALVVMAVLLGHVLEGRLG